MTHFPYQEILDNKDFNSAGISNDIKEPEPSFLQDEKSKIEMVENKPNTSKKLVVFAMAGFRFFLKGFKTIYYNVFCSCNFKLHAESSSLFFKRKQYSPLNTIISEEMKILCSKRDRSLDEAKSLTEAHVLKNQDFSEVNPDAQKQLFDSFSDLVQKYKQSIRPSLRFQEV